LCPVYGDLSVLESLGATLAHVTRPHRWSDKVQGERKHKPPGGKNKPQVGKKDGLQ